MNYEAKARRLEQRLFEREDISDINKKILRRFLLAYDVSWARRIIFIQKIRPLMIRFKDVHGALSDRDGINDLFAELRQRYRPATYSTYITVTNRFLTWLNAGKKAPATCDLKAKRGKDMKRDLRPEDMLTWKDGEQIAAATSNLQMAAIVLTQLDCGFRPSEFIDLNYGDVQVRTGLAIFHVRDGKTGGRSVVARRCVPALLKWLESHPGRRAEDPLWVCESQIRADGSHNVRLPRYAYGAIRKRIRCIGERLGIRKPLDFYGLRHSSCVLDKIDNLPTDLAAQRHGHSVKHFVDTYGRLSVDDDMRRFHSHYGMETEEVPQKAEPVNCPTCHHVNAQSNQWCGRCGTPFTSLGAAEIVSQQGVVQEADAMREELMLMKKELEAARKRERFFQKEQLDLLRQVRSVQNAMGQSQQLLQKVR